MQVTVSKELVPVTEMKEQKIFTLKLNENEATVLLSLISTTELGFNNNKNYTKDSILATEMFKSMSEAGIEYNATKFSCSAKFVDEQ